MISLCSRNSNFDYLSSYTSKEKINKKGKILFEEGYCKLRSMAQRVLWLGLDGAGKSSLINRLKAGEAG